MFSGNTLQCLYSLPSVNVNFSVELFPPKCVHALRSAVTEYITAHRYTKFKFASLTCGAANADKHNSYKLLLALNSVVASPKLLAHLIQADKSLETLWVFVQALKLLGVNKVLFLKGDRYAGAQLRLDAASAFQTLRKTRRLSLFCAATSYPEIYSLNSSSCCERGCARIKRALGCSYSITQFFNAVDAFAKSSIRACLLSESLNVPGFVISVKRPLSLRISAKCGVYIHSYVKRLVSKACAYAKRTILIRTIAKLYSMLLNNIRWFHVFALNKFRMFCKLAWLFSLKEISL
ncbi:MAG: methylenetetrahydrofolate reductase [Candidatus Hodgkinia cicadicola]